MVHLGEAKEWQFVHYVASSQGSLNLTSENFNNADLLGFSLTFSNQTNKLKTAQLFSERLGPFERRTPA